MRTIIALTCLLRSTNAYSTFSTTCTIPIASFNYVSSPDARGTLDILWSSLFTIFACTWTIQHLNVPEQRPLSSKGWRQDLKWQLKGAWTYMKWMLLTGIAPEFILGKAIVDLYEAKKLREALAEYTIKDGVEWELIHCFYAAMGGFVLRSCPEVEYMREGQSTITPQTSESAPVSGDPNPPGRSQSTLIDPECHPRVRLLRESNNTKVYHMDGRDILWLRQHGHLARLPDISTAELKDRGQGDIISKLIATEQVSWYLLQVVIRVAESRSVSPLEVATTAFAICSIIIYLVLLQKPKGVQTAMNLVQDIDDAALTEILNKRCNCYLRVFSSLVSQKGRDSEPVCYGPVRNDSSNNERIAPGLAVGAAVFGSVHLAAWELVHSTNAERTLWRVASVASTVLIPLIWVFLAMFAYVLTPILGTSDRQKELCWKWSTSVITTLYLIARLFLIVEMFRSLAFLPADAYVSTWASNIPHLG